MKKSLIVILPLIFAGKVYLFFSFAVMSFDPHEFGIEGRVFCGLFMLVGMVAGVVIATEINKKDIS